MSDENSSPFVPPETPAETATPSEPSAAQRVAGPVSPKPRNRAFWGLLGGCLVAFVIMTVVTTFLATLGTDADPSFFPGTRIGVVPIEGEIVEARQIVELLEEYGESDGVRAIVVRINSPGGAIVPSQEIFEAIRRVRRESKKPVVASLDSVAASGGYYIAVGCDRIVSNPGTLTGSIGVIAQWFNMEDLVRWAKLKPQSFASGSMKDAGSPFDPMSEGERAYFQHLVAELHGQFVRAVAAGRKGHITPEQVARLADGRVFTGEEAYRLKLVDKLGDMRVALDLAAEMAGLDHTPRVIYPREKERGLLELLTDTEAAQKVIGKVLRVRDGSPFQYRWRF